jgi:hypothetical protein
VSDHTVNLIVLHPAGDDEAWTVYSPQIEGFSGGRDSVIELQRDLRSMLRFAGVSPTAKIRVHTEKLYEADGLDYVIRVANDDLGESRQNTASRLQGALAIPGQREDLLDAPKTRTGEVLFICAEPTDRIEDLAAQLHPGGDAAVIVAPVAEDLIWTSHFTNSDDLLTGARPIEELGWSPDMTVSEIMRVDSMPSGGPQRVRLPVAA